MSLQDDIFDVEAALEGKPELDGFIHIMEKFYELENKEEFISTILDGLKDVEFAIQEYKKFFNKELKKSNE